MKPRSDQTVVIAGYWNRMIFTPEWVGRELFGGSDLLEVEVPIMPIEPIIYSNNIVKLFVSTSRLKFIAKRPNQECLDRVERLAKRVLNILDDTPVYAIGINFSFNESKPPKELKALFDFADEGNVKKSGWTTTDRRFVRHLTSGGKNLSMMATYSANVVDFDFNFHYSARSKRASEALGQLEKAGVSDHWAAATELLRRVYKLEMQVEDNNG